MKDSFIMLDYASIAAVAAVVREGTFERGAAALGITPSAISQRVRGLEERLGAILIVRGQPCMPTELGRTLCAHWDRVRLLEHDLAPVLGAVGGGGASGAGAPLTLRIAVNADSLPTWFPAAVAAFDPGPGVTFDLALDDETRTADRLRANEVVAAVTDDPEPVQGCRTIPIGALRYAACATPAFAARHFAGGVTDDALARAPHIRFDRHDLLQARWAREAHGAGLTGPVHRVPSTHGMLDFVGAGLGWGMNPVRLVEAELAAGRLVELPPVLRLDVRLYWTVARLHAATLRRLTDAIRAVASRELA